MPHGGLQPPVQARPQKRPLNEAYCLVDDNGEGKPFSSITELSGKQHETMISNVFCSGPARMLWAVKLQSLEEEGRLQRVRDAVADFLEVHVSDAAARGMRSKGVGTAQAEVDTVYAGSLEEFAESIAEMSQIIVRSTCRGIEHVLVEACSDSRLVAMKFYQIEIQSSLVKRQGFLARDRDLEPIQLQPETTAFAIIFNRAALRIQPQELAESLGLTEVAGLLEEKKLHLVYFQSDAALPAACKIASKAKEEASKAKEEASKAKEEASKAKEEASEAKEKAEAAEKKADAALQQLQGKALWVSSNFLVGFPPSSSFSAKSDQHFTHHFLPILVLAP